MQYCKNCGRQLKEGARFCDRCGHSVRQEKNTESEKKQRQIEKLQKERLERKKRQDEREAIDERRRQRRQEKRKKQNKILIWTGVCVAAVVVIAVISYIVTTVSSKDEEWKTNQPIGGLTTDMTPTIQPSSTQTTSTAAPSEEKESKYKSYKLSNGMSFEYPSDFTKEDTRTSEEKLRVSGDSDALITVTSEEYPGGNASSLMKKYADNTTGKVSYSLAGNDWYAITIEDGDTVKHRKYIIDRENDLSVYYDFEYDGTSDNAEQYEKYADHMDDIFASSKESNADSE